MKPVIAYLGLGGMGMPMAKRLLDAGYPTTVWNRSPDKAAALAGSGARIAMSPADAVAGADFVFTMVADDHALDDIVLGDKGLLGAMRPGAMHVSMSTILPETSRRLAVAHGEHGTTYVGGPGLWSP